MYRKILARVVMFALSAGLLAACEDKTGLAEEFAIVTSNSLLNIRTGEAFTFNAQVIDRFQNPLPVRITAVSESTNVAVIDSVTFDTILLVTRVFGRGVTVGQSRILLSAQSLKDTVVINVTAPPASTQPLSQAF